MLALHTLHRIVRLWHLRKQVTFRFALTRRIAYMPRAQPKICKGKCRVLSYCNRPNPSLDGVVPELYSVFPSADCDDGQVREQS